MISEAIKALRQNHALEHATISLLLQKVGLHTRLMGQATPGGFYIYGDVPTEMVAEAASEALSRLQKGEVRLAVSPFCGTNFVVAGILAATATIVALGRKNWLRRLPNAILASVLGVLVAQPLGGLTQRYITASTDLVNVRIKGVVAYGKGRTTRHKVETQHTLEEVEID
ncbi:MAG TPA: hypothetical protein G4O03_05500 [Dehalococcoidia bacterium]|jgi:hypothetical protein|nr:hypothetical protein [Dehalococcoidia bacterium]